MTNSNGGRIYALLAPRQKHEENEVAFGYDTIRAQSGSLQWGTKIRLAQPVAEYLAEESAYPQGVQLGVMKQIATTKEITLEQMRILLGWAARKAKVV